MSFPSEVAQSLRHALGRFSGPLFVVLLFLGSLGLVCVLAVWECLRSLGRRAGK